MTQPLTRAELEAAIAKYGPTLRLHPDEQYVNCSIEWFLTHTTLIDSKNPSSKVVHPLEDQLPQGPRQGTRFYLDVEESAKPGNFDTAKAYVNCFWQPSLTYTDLQFWFFSGYNGHGTARFDSLAFDKIEHVGDVNLAPLGEHWADWEYVAIRIDNTSKEMIGIMLSEHGKNILFEGGQLEEFQMVNGSHPVIYSSLNGHANYPGAGPNFTEHIKVLGVPVGLEFDLVNSTADGGLSLDCSVRHEIVAAEWLKEGPDAVVSPAWVGYLYRWGPEGTTIHMTTKTLSNIIKVSVGHEAAVLLDDNPITLAAAELLHIFVKSNINGTEAPSGQAPWSGHY